MTAERSAQHPAHAPRAGARETNQTFTSSSARAPHAGAGEAERDVSLPSSRVRDAHAHEAVSKNVPGVLSGDVRQAPARARPLDDDDTATIERMMENGASLVRTARQLGTTQAWISAWVRESGRTWPTKAERRRIHQEQHAAAQELRAAQFRDGTRTRRTSTGQLTRRARRDARSGLSREQLDRRFVDQLVRLHARAASPEIRAKIEGVLAEVRNQDATTEPSTSQNTTTSGH